MEIKKLEQSFSVCQVEDYSLVNLDAGYCFIGKTDEETSLVCAAGDVPQNVIRRDDGWRAFRIQGVEARAHEARHRYGAVPHHRARGSRYRCAARQTLKA